MTTQQALELGAQIQQLHDGVANFHCVTLPKETSMTIMFLWIDLAKNVFPLHGVDRAGKAALVRPALRRDQLLKMVTKLSPCAIGIEACSGAHHRAREIAKFGHTVKPMIRIWVRTHRGTTRPFVDVQSPNSRLNKGEHPETEQHPGHVGKSL